MSDKKTFFGNLLAGAGNAITGGLFGLGSSLLTNRGAKSRQQLADANNIKFWNMQNEYNTPKAQMQRLQDAGLNPALIYGSGATNTGVAGSIAPSKPAPYNIKNPVPLQALLLEAQIRNINAGSKKAELEGQQIEQLLGGKVTAIGLKNDLNKIKLDIAGKSKEDQLTIIKNSALSSGFNKEIKRIDKDAALEGFVKGNPVYTIFKQLGIAGEGNQYDEGGKLISNKVIRQGLIYGLLGSTIAKNLSGPINKIIEKLTGK